MSGLRRNSSLTSGNGHALDLPPDPENVCSSGWTGSGRPIAKTALLTRDGHGEAQAGADLIAIRPSPR